MKGVSPGAADTVNPFHANGLTIPDVNSQWPRRRSVLLASVRGTQ